MALMEFGRIGYEMGKRELCYCLNCNSNLVRPLDIEPVNGNDDIWDVKLDCPNCPWTEEGEFPIHQVEILIDEIDRSIDTMLGSEIALNSRVVL